MPPDAELDPTRFRVRFSSARGFRMAFVDEGSGPTLLLVHGWPETKRIWWRNVAPLARAGFRVIAPDLRGFGESDIAPDGFEDVPSHSRDLAALLDELGIATCVPVAGDLGGAVIQDFARRFPSRVPRMVIFNSPLPFLKDKMTGLRTRPAAEAADYYLRQGTDADALAQELDSAAKRRRYIATFYGSRFWAHPGTFTRDAVDFMTEPFADAAKLRASFGNYESSFAQALRSEPPLLAENPTHTLILFGASDHVIYPEFDRMAAQVFPDHVGPFIVRDAGHFLQWEAADVLNGAVMAFCRDLLPR
jgi:pimeloyl-ACP methyl ester carboxylesterase